jgi:transglutaminase-like putative cysteine protease
MLCQNQAHLTPRESYRQKCLGCKLDVSPTPASMRPWTDAFGNAATYFSIEQAHRELVVSARSHVEVLCGSTRPDQDPAPWEEAVARIENRDQRGDHDLTAFLCRSNKDGSDAIHQYAMKSFPPGRVLFDAVLELTERIHADFQYEPAVTTIGTPPAEVLLRRRGVCQDFAHFQNACLRSLGLSSRYVSGYLVTQPPPGKQRLIGADATHAWVSVYFPGWGWVDFDPTNCRLTNTDYITLAWGRDYTDVSPIRGVFLGGGAHHMNVSVDVVPSAN